MPTNLAIDDKLLKEALKLGKFSSKKETVNQALGEFIQRRRRTKILDLMGKVDWDKDYDYKKERKKRR